MVTSKKAPERRCCAALSLIHSIAVDTTYSADIFVMSSIGANYFRMDEEDVFMEAAATTTAASLDWREDPSSTWSDWTIVISRGDAQGPLRHYHVHRNILAAGPRRCHYFATLFATPTRVSEQVDCTSRIALGVDEAENFETLLDFMYSNDGAVQVHVGNVVPLRSLARYFQCRELMRYVNRHVQTDLRVETAVAYFQNAHGRDEKVEQASRKLIVEHFDKMPLHSMDTLPTSLFQSIVRCNGIQESQHRNVSIHVCSFFQANPNALSAQLLHQFTRHLTEIDASVARGFLDLVAQLDPNYEHEESWLALDQLSQACANALAPNWNELDMTKSGMERFLNPPINGDFRGSGRCVVPVLEASLERAKCDYKRAKEECNVLSLQNQILKGRLAALMGPGRAIQGYRHDFFTDSSISDSDSSSSSGVSSSPSDETSESETSDEESSAADSSDTMTD